MRDPVTGFLYPATWEAKATNPAGLSLAARGFAVLTASGTVLLRGYTTGTTAAAACKAAILSLSGNITEVRIRLPCGLEADLPVTARDGRASCKKYAGDYPSDVTAGLEFVAEAARAPEGILLVPGTGIGRYIRDTPRYKKGEPAISEAPLACILSSMEEALAETGLSGTTVTLSIPDGERVAKKTLNPQVGIEGGISVLGSTGLVEPWDDHLEESVMARVAGAEDVVITTGRIGLRYARLLFPDHEVVLAGGKIKEALSAAKGNVTLCGLPALILKYIEPHILDSTGFATVEELASSPAFFAAVTPVLAAYKKKYPRIRVVLVNREGTIIAESP
ncbi:cobalt-precorrin-5B (C(1))-methyltransferase [Methanoregula sp.]|uniref:cobalt-precorrin-5B (C(1))-methyltransferase n=1 Tax=Methanoregula sp. TaxID=2052170 RepID=UPI002D02FD2E|nr:cobalt-precorrin-5B (C(1))-methyltransferase [Methanoregula sp.]HVP96014.1 cobalt-precorrin-5B (C(1))-methyltransferase [Methanoregula sp.]